MGLENGSVSESPAAFAEDLSSVSSMKMVALNHL